MLGMGENAPRKGADAMAFVGCDLHTRMQRVAVLDTEAGKVSERQVAHEGTAVEEFYAGSPRPVTVGIESTGYAVWFHALMQRLGTRCSSAMRRRSAPWSCARRRPIAATPARGGQLRDSPGMGHGDPHAPTRTAPAPG